MRYEIQYLNFLKDFFMSNSNSFLRMKEKFDKSGLSPKKPREAQKQVFFRV